MYTPIARVFNDGLTSLKEVKPSLKKNNLIFYDENEFKKYKETLPSGKKIKVKYYKGLGTSTTTETKETFGRKIAYFSKDEKANDNMKKAFSSELSDLRKKWIGDHIPSSPTIVWNTDKIEFKELEISKFIDNDLIEFSKADCVRSIPHIMDGFKESQRKVLYALFKRNISFEKSAIKVAQLAGSVAEICDYHHGEQNLFNVIIGMAQNFSGSNNINLLHPEGQFGSRMQNGADFASARYIFTKLTKISKLIFKEEDEPLLTPNLNDEKEEIEPTFFIPIIPMILVNGAQGIGTGWSTNIPCFNPKDLINWIRIWIQENGYITDSYDEFKDLIPWYNGYKGEIKNNEGKITMEGKYEQIPSKKDTVFKITEIPLDISIDKYKSYLEDLLDLKKISDMKYYSSDNEPNFIITSNPEITINSDILKLKSSISLTNMVAFKIDGTINKFKSAHDILKYFCEERFKYYIRRKEYLLEIFEYKLLISNNKKRFIENILNGTLILRNKSIEILEKELFEEKYDSDRKDNFDYLLSLNVRQMTKDNVDKLTNEIIKLTTERDVLKGTEPKTLWLNDLKELEESF